MCRDVDVCHDKCYVCRELLKKCAKTGKKRVGVEKSENLHVLRSLEGISGTHHRMQVNMNLC